MIDSVPDSFDWMMVKKFTECLQHFYYATLRISGSLYMTANRHFHEICKLHLILSSMIDSDDFEVRDMGLKMKLKFDKYWGDPDKMNKIIFFANVFDPSSKLEVIQFSFQTMFGHDKGVELFNSVVNELTLLFDEYQSLYA